MNFQVRLLFKSTSFLWSFGFHRGTVFQVSLNKISCLVPSFFYMAFTFEQTFNSWAIDHLMWTFHFFKAGTNFDMNSGRRNCPLWVKSCHDYSPKLVWPGLVRSALRKTVLSAYVSALASDSIQNLGLKFSQWGHTFIIKGDSGCFNFCIEQINRLTSARQLGLCSRRYTEMLTFASLDQNIDWQD